MKDRKTQTTINETLKKLNFLIQIYKPHKITIKCAHVNNSKQKLYWFKNSKT